MEVCLSTMNFVSRIHWLDVVRGIAIIFVVLGHTSIPGEVGVKWISSFHMPLFFVISGYCYKQKSLGELFKRRLKTMIIPYFAFYGIYILVELFLNIRAFDESLISHIVDIILGNDVMLWFLVALFLVELIYTLLTNYISSTKMLTVIVVVLAAIGFLLAQNHIELCYRIHTAFIMIGFYHLGVWVSRKNFFEAGYLKSVLWMLFLCIINIATMFFNVHIDVRTGVYGNYVLFYIAAISGSFLIFFVGKLINKSKLLELLGRNTLCIYAFNVKIANWLAYVFEKLELGFSVKLFSGILLIIIILISEYDVFCKVWNRMNVMLLESQSHGKESE